MDKREFLAAAAAATVGGAASAATVGAAPRRGPVTGITPSATGAQGDAPLYFNLNVLSQTPQPGYSVTLPASTGSGNSVEVITRSLEFIVIFPPVGERISFFDTNTGYAIYPGTALTFLDTAPGQWDMVYNVASNYPVLVGIAARPGGGQAGATRLCYGSNVIATCATAGDSVMMPVALGAGEQCFITNHGQAACHLYPWPGERLNAMGVDVPYLLPPGKAAMFVDIGPPNQWDGGAFS